jgi:hypothetical protein
VGMSLYHFKPAVKFDAESWDRKIVYSSLEVDYSEMFFDVSNVLIRLFGCTIRIKEGVVFGWRLMDCSWFSWLKMLSIKFISTLYIFKSKMMSNIDQKQAHLGYYSSSSYKDD